MYLPESSGGLGMDFSPVTDASAPVKPEHSGLVMNEDED